MSERNAVQGTRSKVRCTKPRPGAIRRRSVCRPTDDKYQLDFSWQEFQRCWTGMSSHTLKTPCSE